MIFGRKKLDIGKLRTQAAAPVPYGFDPEMTPDYSVSDKPALQAKPSIGNRLIGSALDGLGAAFGLEPTYLQGIQAQRQSQLEAQNAAEKFKRERDAKTADDEAASYRPQQVGRTIVARTADGYKEIYREPEQATQFQRDLGALGIPLDSPQARQIFQSRYDPFKTATIPDEGGGTVTIQTGGLSGLGEVPFENLIQQESRGRQFGPDGSPLRSRSGAIGIAQVMPGTAPEAARLAGVPFDENRYKSDPAYNRALGEAYYKEMVRQFGPGEKAVAAYNAGPGRVREAVNQGGENGWKSRLPAETKDYIQKVSGRPVLGRKPPEVKKSDIATMSTAQKLQRLRELRGGR